MSRRLLLLDEGKRITLKKSLVHRDKGSVRHDEGVRQDEVVRRDEIEDAK